MSAHCSLILTTAIHHRRGLTQLWSTTRRDTIPSQDIWPSPKQRVCEFPLHCWADSSISQRDIVPSVLTLRVWDKIALSMAWSTAWSWLSLSAAYLWPCTAPAIVLRLLWSVNVRLLSHCNHGVGHRLDSLLNKQFRLSYWPHNTLNTPAVISQFSQLSRFSW